MSFYCYIPIKSKFTTIENTIEFIEKNLLCKVIKNDYECFSTLTNYQIEFSNETVWINTITNTDFASDTRDFIRFRLSTSCNRLIEHLKKITKDLNGYYGMSSKIFLDSDNKKVYDVKDGENYILLSGGEIVREIETAEPKYTFEYLR